MTTADFITPPLDDPFLFGQIAAANSISDVYAMGGRPVSCLNLVSFPSNKLGPEILQGLVEGALSAITEAGAVLAGGHTIEDEEPKFGLAVTGFVHPERIWRNAGAQPGDALILTKPLGSGIIFNGNLKNMVSEKALQTCIDTVTMLNKSAAETAARFTVHAATDVTGFGLAGHAYEMAKGAGVTFEIEVDALPVLPEALQTYRKGMNTGVNPDNRALVEKYTRIEKSLPDWHAEILFDPQTNGGLLFALPEAEARAAVTALHDNGVAAATVIGAVKEPISNLHLLFH